MSDQLKCGCFGSCPCDSPDCPCCMGHGLQPREATMKPGDKVVVLHQFPDDTLTLLTRGVLLGFIGTETARVKENDGRVSEFPLSWCSLAQ